MSFRRRRFAGTVGVCMLLAALLPASRDGSQVNHRVSADLVAAESSALPPAVRIEPPTGAVGVRTEGAVRVLATSGALTEVSMVNETGREVFGRFRDDAREWVPAEPLGYGRAYRVSATSGGVDGATATRMSRFSTVVPDRQTSVRLGLTSGADIVDGATYGVGTVVVATFNDPIPDRASAERRLRVSTTPAVEGAWYWINDQRAHWRPREHFPAGTRVAVSADIYGVDLGEGLYGNEDKRVGFVIGPSHVTIADDVTKRVTVYADGKLVRTMRTSMGRGGSETVGGKTISFWTQPGVYTVMEKENPVLMDSSTFGLPVDSPSGYKISVPHAVRISPDGIYLHEREATVWAQGNTNVSAGCLNLSAADAEWFYEFSRPGDVVEIRNTGGAPLQLWQNGDWSLSWQEWLKGSALAS